MFFYLSKIVWFLTQPSSLVALLVAAGLIVPSSRPRLKSRLLWSGWLLLIGFGLSPLGGALLLPLEERFPRPDLSRPGTHVDGVVVLGGAEDPRVGALRHTMALNEAAEREIEALNIAQKFPEAKVVFSGGSAEILNAKPPEAEAAARFFIELGLAPSRLLIESHSRNTYENAVFSRDLVKPKPGEHWLLITSAFHMPRAMGCFRKAGFAVEAFPVDYRTSGFDEMRRPFSSIPEGLRRIDFVLKEYVGLLVYYLTGRTDALFPRP